MQRLYSGVWTQKLNCVIIYERYILYSGMKAVKPQTVICVFPPMLLGDFFLLIGHEVQEAGLFFLFFSKEMLRANVLTVSHTVNPINFKVILKTQEYIYDLCKNEGKNIKYITVKAFILKGIIML